MTPEFRQSPFGVWFKRFVRWDGPLAVWALGILLWLLWLSSR